MPYELLMPLNVYPKGELPAGTIINRDDLPLGASIANLISGGLMRPTDGEVEAPAPTDATGWQQRAEKAEGRLKELKEAKPDKAAAENLKKLQTEHERLENAHEDLRASHEAVSGELQAVTIDRNEARTELGRLKGEDWKAPVAMLEPSTVGTGADASPVMQKAEEPVSGTAPRKRRSQAEIAADAAALRQGADAAAGAHQADEQAKIPGPKAPPTL